MSHPEETWRSPHLKQWGEPVGRYLPGAQILAGKIPRSLCGPDLKTDQQVDLSWVSWQLCHRVLSQLGCWQPANESNWTPSCLPSRQSRMSRKKRHPGEEGHNSITDHGAEPIYLLEPHFLKINTFLVQLAVI